MRVNPKILSLHSIAHVKHLSCAIRTSFSMVLGIEPKASHMLGGCSTTDATPQPDIISEGHYGERTKQKTVGPSGVAAGSLEF